MGTVGAGPGAASCRESRWDACRMAGQLYAIMMHFWNKQDFLRRDKIRKTETQEQLHTDSGPGSVASQMPTGGLPLLQGWREAGENRCEPGSQAQEARVGRGKLRSLGRGFN